MIPLAEHQVHLLQIQHELLSQQLYQAELAKPRHTDWKNRSRLLKHGYKVYSQNDEDGIIAEIFRRIGTTNKTFLEIGVQTGVECNTLKLLGEGWSGIWIEGNEKSVAKILAQNDFQKQLFIKLLVKHAFVTAENINNFISAFGRTDDDLDLFSLDIDCNDYWVWKALTVIRPRVVVIEYNAMWPPPISVVVPYDPKRTWDGSNYFGASLEAMVRLGEDKGYQIVGCNFTGTNAFFVRKDLAGDKDLARELFHIPATATEHYEPVRYHIAMMRGHPPRLGSWEVV